MFVINKVRYQPNQN
ncbi:TPA: erythromycin resistance leader peptide [Staphylococcus aureus]|nr:erythromycin resistance leader peptide [Staphylococcus aureus]